MYKTLAHNLAGFRDKLTASRGHTSTREPLWMAAQWLVANETMPFVEPEFPLVEASERFLNAARAYTGGSQLTAILARSADQDTNAYQALDQALTAFKAALATARHSTHAQHLALPFDTADVPEPF